MARKASWVLVALLATLIGLYPSLYFFIDRNFGLLSSKSKELLANVAWNTAFYIHIIAGGLALLVGWLQFNAKMRTQYVQLHRQIGKGYVIAVLLSAVAGFYIALFATGGIIPSVGFMCLAVVWFYTTYRAYSSIKNKQVEAHRKMMIYSYAACFAAVTLRIWLPLLTAATGDFTTAYRIVAWLCWVPNLIVAGFIARRV